MVKCPLCKNPWSHCFCDPWIEPAIMVKRKAWYNSCPEWFKPLRDMGISPNMWYLGYVSLCGNLEDKHNVAPYSPEIFVAWERLGGMAYDLDTWIEAEPR